MPDDVVLLSDPVLINRRTISMIRMLIALGYLEPPSIWFSSPFLLFPPETRTVHLVWSIQQVNGTAEPLMSSSPRPSSGASLGLPDSLRENTG